MSIDGPEPEPSSSENGAPREEIPAEEIHERSKAEYRWFGYIAVGLAFTAMAIGVAWMALVFIRIIRAMF